MRRDLVQYPCWVQRTGRTYRLLGVYIYSSYVAYARRVDLLFALFGVSGVPGVPIRVSYILLFIFSRIDPLKLCSYDFVVLLRIGFKISMTMLAKCMYMFLRGFVVI